MSGLALIGSCVTRDMFPDVDGPQLAFIARTSLASMFAPQVAGLLLPPRLGKLPPGGFLDRCVRMDVDKTGIDFIERSCPDILLFDFMDERLRLRAASGSIFTASHEFHDGGLATLPPFSAGRTIERLSGEAWALWLDGLRSLQRRVRNGPLASARLVLHRSYLAPRWRAGCNDDVLRAAIDPPPAKLAILRANRLFRRQHEVFLEAFPKAEVIDVPDECLVADGGHVWGPSACHYVPEYYAALRRSAAALGIATGVGADSRCDAPSNSTALHRAAAIPERR